MPDVSDRLNRYFRSWRSWPQAAFALELFDTKSHSAPIHRRSLLGTGSRAALVGARNLWVGARHAMRRTYPDLPASELEAFRQCTDVPVVTQQERLRWLARRGVPPREAMHLGLLLDDGQSRWLLHVWRGLTGWNEAASARGAHRLLTELRDKPATCDRVQPFGVTCPPSLTLARGTTLCLASTVDTWLAKWPVVHGKRRSGSQGEGAFELQRQDDRLELRPYGDQLPVADPLAWLQQALDQTDYLIQPRLLSHPIFKQWADPHDVVTVRIVTRDVLARHGPGQPSVFSACLELPQLTAGRLTYRMAAVDERGQVTGSVLPWWLCEQRRAANELLAPMGAVRLPAWEDTTSLALRAHSAFPGVFAIAWDIALTDSGPMLLEGNTGFGPAVPQWLGGPLLDGIDY